MSVVLLSYVRVFFLIIRFTCRDCQDETDTSRCEFATLIHEPVDTENIVSVYFRSRLTSRFFSSRFAFEHYNMTILSTFLFDDW